MKRSSSPVIKLGENKIGTWRMVSPRTHPKLSQEKQWGQITIESNELVEYIGKTLFVVIYTKPPEIRLHENPEPETQKDYCLSDARATRVEEAKQKVATCNPKGLQEEEGEK